MAKLTYFVSSELHHFPQKPQPRKIPKFHNFWFEFLKPVRYLLQSLFGHNSSIQSTSTDHIRWVYLVFLVRGKEMEDVLVHLLSIPTSTVHFSSLRVHAHVSVHTAHVSLPYDRDTPS